MSVYVAVVNVVVAWGLWTVVFLGLGLGMRRLLAGRDAAPGYGRLVPWVGWGIGVALLQLIHLFRPISGAVALAIVALGLVGLAWDAPRLAVAARALGRRRGLIVLALGVLCALWVANFTVKQPGVYDSGLYHLNAVRWAKEHAIVPGLGNLHARLAYNNASFLYAAMLDHGPFAHRSHQLASGLLMTWLLVDGLLAVAGAWAARPHPPSALLFRALFTAPLVVWIAKTGYPSSPSPDVPVFLLGAVIAGELLQRLAPPDPPARTLTLPVALVFLCLVGTTVKLSFAVFALAVCAVLWFAVASRVRLALAGLLLALLTILPWSVRGVLLSGYPAYPSSFGRVEADWSLSKEAAHRMAASIQAWARSPGQTDEPIPGDWSWLGPWLQRARNEQTFDFAAPLVTGGAGLLLLAWGRWRYRTGPPCRAAWALVPPALALAFWFWSAPDLRFQGAMLWILGLNLYTLGLRAGVPGSVWLALAHGVALLVVCVRPIELVRSWKVDEPARRVPMKTMVTDFNLALYVPVTGDQSWDSDLPATPYFSPRLRLRDPGNMAQGFSRQSAERPFLLPWLPRAAGAPAQAVPAAAEAAP